MRTTINEAITLIHDQVPKHINNYRTININNYIHTGTHTTESIPECMIEYMIAL